MMINNVGMMLLSTFMGSPTRPMVPTTITAVSATAPIGRTTPQLQRSVSPRKIMLTRRVSGTSMSWSERMFSTIAERRYGRPPR